MKAKEEYWDQVFTSYERSGLSKEVFCSQQEIPIAKFKYRWRKKIESVSYMTAAQNLTDQVRHFEPIQIIPEEPIQKESVINESIIIRFPNQVSCEVKADIKSRDFSLLLNQLRLLC